MNKKSLFAFPIIFGLFLSSCGSEDTATPVIDYLTPLQSMVDNIQKYDGPLTIDLHMSGSEGGQTATYRTISSYDKETAASKTWQPERRPPWSRIPSRRSLFLKSHRDNHSLLSYTCRRARPAYPWRYREL